MAEAPSTYRPYWDRASVVAFITDEWPDATFLALSDADQDKYILAGQGFIDRGDKDSGITDSMFYGNRVYDNTLFPRHGGFHPLTRTSLGNTVVPLQIKHALAWQAAYVYENRATIYKDKTHNELSRKEGSAEIVYKDVVRCPRLSPNARMLLEALIQPSPTVFGYTATWGT